MSKEFAKCDKGWHTGECCCSCKNLIELFKHPLNKIHKGSILESTNLYACTLSLDCDNKQEGILFEQQHGFCEMYYPK